MAVKQKVVECVAPSPQSQSAEHNLQFLIRTLREISAEDPQEKEEKCAQIVNALGKLQQPSDPQSYMQFMSGISLIQETLTKECSRYDLIDVPLKALYNEISTCDKPPSPVMSIVLQLFNVKYIKPSVNVILQAGHAPENLKRALFTLCYWLTKWTQTPNLGPLVIAFMEGLENMQHHDILYDVTLATIEGLFKLLMLPASRESVGEIVLHMLHLAHHNPDIFNKIVPQIHNVASRLFIEKSEASLFYLQAIIKLSVSMLDRFPEYANIYGTVKTGLEQYFPVNNPDFSKVMLDQGTATLSEYSSTDKVGLNNLGNTCYMNSVLQALFMTKPFRNDILLNMREVTPLLTKIQSLFALLQFSKRVSLSPTDISHLARPPGFLPGHQHDSSEFLGYLLDVLHEQEKTATKADRSDPTIVQRTFGGRTVTSSTCYLCGTSSARIDNFRELQLAFPNNSQDQSVQTLLNYYLQPEKLNGDNQYHCDVCDSLRDGERTTCIEDAPPRLILTLKHFRYDPASQQRTKLLQRVKLDSHVELEGRQYELYAAVVHCGSSVDSGHYYTFAKDGEDWYKFNDCSVTRIKSEELCNLKQLESPYIVFYNRVDVGDAENLPKEVLPQRLQLLVNKDEMDFDQEKRRRPLRTYNIRQNKNDEPPPPGCGGSGGMNNSPNMFVY